MNGQIISQRVQMAAELAVREPMVKNREEACTQSALTALKRSERDKAREFFEIALVWNQLHEFVQDWKGSVSNGGQLTYIVDVWFLQDLIQHLTPNQDEEITYVTGTSFGRVKILSRICGVTLEKQSVVYARATAKSCTETLATILEKGNLLHVMAHSHPGRGAGATRESSIDVNYLGRIQHAGADVVGIIVTRDGFVRFFTVEKPFQVWVQGNGITQVEENVFQITLPQKNRH
jgi:hypothetical protein